MLMWRRGRKDGCSGGKEAESLEEEENWDGEDKALWCVGRGSDLSSLFHLGFFFSSCRAHTRAHTHKPTLTHFHLQVNTHRHTLKGAGHAGEHAHTHIWYTVHEHNPFLNTHTHTSVLFFHPYLFIFSSFSLTSSCEGPLAAWPVFQVHSPGNFGPNKGGIPVPPGSVSQVHTAHRLTQEPHTHTTASSGALISQCKMHILYWYIESISVSDHHTLIKKLI